MITFKAAVVILGVALVASASEIENDGVDNYVVGGEKAMPGQFPHIVSLRTIQNKHFCSGVILNDRWIATAAHCTQGRMAQANAVLVAVGAHSRTDGKRLRVARIFNHPSFNPQNFARNFALILLNERIQFNERVKPARFPRGPDIRVGRTFHIAGWGLTQRPAAPGRGVATHLHWTKATTMKPAQCKQALGQQYAGFFHTGSICTRNAGGGACIGDAGGPLTLNDGTVIGVISWDGACNRNIPTIYSALFSFRAFMSSASRGELPPRQ